MTTEIRRNFLASEVSNPVEAPAVATLDNDGNIIPAFTGGDDEGAVYGCIFVDFARRTGLRTVVNSYFQSVASGATSFGDYKTWISHNRTPQDLAALEAAQQTWGL
jgi:hypothetical protein